jgi:hypothetical protein
MPKEFWFVIATFVLLLILLGWAISVVDEEFRVECRSHGGIPIISKAENVCYAPGIIIDIRS